MKEQSDEIIRTDKLIYYNELLMESSKESIKNGIQEFVSAFNQVKDGADRFMIEPISTVVDKTLLPPSGNKHDYMSIAPYFWPDESKSDGLPWIPHDGEINPASRSEKTDFVRTSGMFAGVGNLCASYYFSNDTKYLCHALKVITAWFIDENTRMNPSIKYGQSVPGGIEGRCLGVIEWGGIANIVTAVQLLKRNHMMTNEQLEAVADWFRAYVSWLRRSRMGIEERDQNNNHGTNYDYQVAGILLLLYNDAAAEELFESVKTKRIGYYLQPDGSQPYELRRTKSVNYHNTDVWPLTEVVELAMRISDIDLWNYKSPTGVSLKKAFDYLHPYATGEKQWQWEQIDDSAEIKMAKMIRPLLLKVNKLFDYQIGDISNQSIALSAMDTLRFHIYGNDKSLLSATYIVKETYEASVIRIDWMVCQTGIVKYVLLRKEAKDAEFTKISEFTKDEKRYTDNIDLEYGKTYKYRLESIDASGNVIESVESNEILFSSKWIELKDELLNAKEGTSKTVDLYMVEKVPGFVFNVIKGRNVTLRLNTVSRIEGNPVYWTVNGLDIKNDVKSDSIFDVLPQFSLGTSLSGRSKLPADGDVYKEFGMVALTGYNYKAKLFINIGTEYALYKMRLFHFGRQGVVEVTSDLIAREDGSLVIEINSAPDYTLVLYKDPAVH